MDDYESFQDEIFDQLREREERYRSKVFEDFVRDAEACGFTIDDLIAMTQRTTSGGDFLRIFKEAACARGVGVKE